MREKRTIAVGAAVVALTALVTLVAIPFATRWNLRERAILAARERVARLEGLARQVPLLRQRADSIDESLEAGGVRMFRARSAPLAAAEVQAFVQEAARQSRVIVSRLDVAGAASGDTASATALPASISASGDIYGVADYLRRLQFGERLISIDELTIMPNPASPDQLLQLTLSLRVPIVLEP